MSMKNTTASIKHVGRTILSTMGMGFTGGAVGRWPWVHLNLTIFCSSFVLANFGPTEGIDNGIYKVKYAVSPVQRLDKVWICVHLYKNPTTVQSLSKSKLCPDFVHLETDFWFIFGTGRTKFGFVCICTKIRLVSRVYPCPKFVQSLSNLKGCAGYLVGQSPDKPWM